MSHAPARNGLRPDAPRRPAAFLVDRAAFLLLAGVVSILLVRATIRDRVPIIAVAFYAGQPLILAAACICAAILDMMYRRRWRATGAVAIAVVCAAWWMLASFRTAPAEQPARGDATPLRLVVWNIGGGRLGNATIREVLARERPDVAVFVEVSRHEESPSVGDGALRRIGRLDNLVSFVRGDVLSVADDRTSGARIQTSLVRTKGREFRVVAVDVPSNPLRPRGAALAAIRAAAEGGDSRPTIVLGDFNTPPDSAHFDALRPHFMNTFEAAGEGYGPTWPIPVPLLMLDQVWVSGQFRAVRCAAKTAWISDHRYVVCDVLLP